MASIVKWSVWSAFAVALAAGAQPRADDPAQAASPSPPLAYRSAFADYRAFGDSSAGDWRAVNERVREAAAARGGHGQAQGTMRAPVPASPGTASGSSGAGR